MDDGGESEGGFAELEQLRARVLELESRLPGEGRAAPHGATSFGHDARERLLSEAEQIAHMGSFAWDISTDAIYWSDELYRILGYAVGEVTPSQDAFFDAIPPDHRERVKEVAARSIAAGVGEAVGFRIVRRDGAVRHLHMKGVAIPDGDGPANRFVGVILDETERVEAEAELRRRGEIFKAAQRIAHVGSFEWNPFTGKTVWSEELYRICGLPVDGQGTFDRYFALVHPDDRGYLVDYAANVEAGQTIGPHEYRIVRPDGTTAHVYAEASPVYDAEGRPDGWVGTVLDITHLKRLEAQLLQSQKMEALGRLAGGVAHDFNNLLTVIGVHVELLRRKRDERELEEVAGAVERAGQLTRQLLAFSRQAVFELRRIDPVKNVRDSLRMMKRIVGEDVQIAFESEPDVGAVSVDPAQLEQVLLNLLVNARDALPGGGHVGVKLETAHVTKPWADAQPALAPGAYVVLEVSDDGVGMDEVVRSRALEPFFTTKEPGRGTGLGLAMVFGIVSQSRGGMTIESAKGVGTTVRVYFPLADTEVEAPTIDPRTTEEKAGAGELVLLVDDDRAIGRLLATVLDDAGYRVHVATNGAAALAFFADHEAEVRVVVTDVVMPQMGGPELVRRLRERSPGLPALYLSGYAKEGREGDDPSTRGAFLMKPFTPVELVRRVTELVARHRTG